MVTINGQIQSEDHDRTEFVWDVPDEFNFAADVVDNFASSQPDKLALLWTNEKGDVAAFTFADMARLSNQYANLLTQAGVARGDFVLVMLPRIPAWQVTMLALLKIGAIAVPCTTLLQPKDLEYRANFAGATAVIAHVQDHARVDAARAVAPTLKVFILEGGTAEGWTSASQAATQPSHFTAARTSRSDPALGYFTSGTTGGPKMVLHSHGYTWSQRLTGIHWLDLKPGDVHWNLSDTGWAKAAYSTLFGPWHVGSTVFVADGPFVPTTVLEMLGKHRITSFCAPPTVFRVLVKEDLESYRFYLRHVVAAGEPLNPEVIRTWADATGTTIYDGYGQTETIILACNLPSMPVKPGAMGKPFVGHEVSIIDEEGNEVDADVEGDIALKGAPPSLFIGYYKNEELTARCWRGQWYVTGDRGYKDSDGYLWFVGRGDDVIISAGYRIGPFEVESVLITHPAVVESAVVASPDAVRGHIVKAFVVLRNGHVASESLAKELQEHVKSLTAPYKYPREIEFVADLPKTVSGKIRRVELRKLEEDRKREVRT